MKEGFSVQNWKVYSEHFASSKEEFLRSSFLVQELGTWRAVVFEELKRKVGVQKVTVQEAEMWCCFREGEQGMKRDNSQLQV